MAVLEGVTSASDIESVYVPLAQELGERLLRRPPPPVPIVAVIGGVAVGKSTSAHVLQQSLLTLPEKPRVELVATDGFLLSNRELEARGLTMRKGFPETYDTSALERFLVAARAGAPELRVPVYSHEMYDVVPDEEQVVRGARVVIVEGLGLTQTTLAPLLDFVIYVDADERDVREWFLARFLSMFPPDLLDVAQQAWEEINVPNLHEHILPARATADLVLEKGPDHSVQRVVLREPSHDTMGA